MIEQNWSLTPLSIRDATARNLADELDFELERQAPQFTVPPGPFGLPCPSEGPGNGFVDEATGLRALAEQYGFPLP